MVTKRAKNESGGERFVRLNHNLLVGDAWLSLSPAQRSVYVSVMLRYNGFNNGEIGLSVREAATLSGCNKDTAGRALKVLEEKGFIQKMQEGAFSYKKRHAALFRVTHLPADIGGRHIPATSDFKNWRPQKEPRSGSRG